MAGFLAVSALPGSLKAPRKFDPLSSSTEVTGTNADVK
jgi:hypothetical protein